MASARSLPLLTRALRRHGSIQGFASGQSSVVANRSWPPHVTYVQPESSPCHIHPLRTINGIQTSSYSTTAPRSIFGWAQEKLAARAKSKKDAKLIDQIALMANSPTWTVKMFADEIDETLSSWTTKMPGASRTTEIMAAKETQKVVKAIMAHMGDGVCAGDIAKLDRKGKLKLAIACQKPMGEMNTTLNSFKQMEIMHRILRYRKENGIELPNDEVGLKMAMQKDGIKVMTKEEKQEMKDMYQKSMSQTQ